jgi:hypothetical protein
VLHFTIATALSVEKDDRETGELDLTQKQYRGLINGKNDALGVAKVLKSVLDRIIIKLLVNCWNLYKKFMDDNKASFQKLANKICRN